MNELVDYDLEMQLHKKIKDLMVMFALCAPPDDTVHDLKLRYLITGATVFIVLFVLGLSCFVPIHHAENVEVFLNSSCDTVCSSCAVFSLAIVFLQREQLKVIFMKLQQFYDQCKNSM